MPMADESTAEMCMTEAPTLHDARVLVVGGSSGIGRAIAFHAAQAGAQVCVAARRSAELAALCDPSPQSHPITSLSAPLPPSPAAL